MKFFILMTMLTLLIAGCSDGRDQATATGSGAGLERQEEDVHGQTPGFEKQEYRENYKPDDANITTPIDSRPDLEEEE